MGTDDINKIFGNISPENRPEISDSNEYLAREWEELQASIPELDGVLLNENDYPSHDELNEIRTRINQSGGSNPSWGGLGIMLSVFIVTALAVSLIVNMDDSEYFLSENKSISLKQYKGAKIAQYAPAALHLSPKAISRVMELFRK